MVFLTYAYWHIFLTGYAVRIDMVCAVDVFYELLILESVSIGTLNNSNGILYIVVLKNTRLVLNNQIFSFMDVILTYSSSLELLILFCGCDIDCFVFLLV